MFAKEAWGSERSRFRHAQLVVAAMQGPSTRQDGQPWVTAHVTGADPWAPAGPPKPVRPAKRLSIAQQARAMNAQHRRL